MTVQNYGGRRIGSAKLANLPRMGTDYNDKTAETGRPWDTEYIRQRMATLQKTIEIFLESKSGRIIFLKTNFFCKYQNAFTFFLVTSGLLPLLFKQCVFNLFYNL